MSSLISVDYRSDSYELNTYSENGREYAEIYFDRDNRKGILNFSHELSLTVEIKADNSIALESAWEMNCGGDWSYKKNEAAIFEEDHPGLLQDIERYYRENIQKTR